MLQQQSKYRLGAYVFLGACLVVGGCNTTYSKTAGEPKGATPVTVQALTEKKEEPFDPIKAHMKAREMADPSDTRPQHSYTKKQLSRAVLGPDTDIVMRKKPTEVEHQEYLKIAEAKQNSWFNTLFSGEEKPEEDEESLKIAAVETREPKPQKDDDKGPTPDPKAKPEDEPKQEQKAAVKKGDDKPKKKVAKKTIKKAAPKAVAKKATPKTQTKTAAKTATKSAPKKTTKTAAATKAKSVTNVRVGDHPDKTRMVIDLTERPKFTYQVQDDKNLLVVNLPDTQWSAKEKKVYAKHPLLLAYIAKKAPDGGTILAVKLRKKIKVLKDTVFRPSKTAGHRIVFDIAEG